MSWTNGLLRMINQALIKLHLTGGPWPCLMPVISNNKVMMQKMQRWCRRCRDERWNEWRDEINEELLKLSVLPFQLQMMKEWGPDEVFKHYIYSFISPLFCCCEIWRCSDAEDAVFSLQSTRHPKWAVSSRHKGVMATEWAAQAQVLDFPLMTGE